MISPGGYVVITFSVPPSHCCTWPACPMGAEWFPDHEAAWAYMARLPAWTDPHLLPVSDFAWRAGSAHDSGNAKEPPDADQ